MEEKIETKEGQVQEPKRKKMDPNDKKIIFCSLAILGLVIVPLVVTKALTPKKQEDPLVRSLRMKDSLENIIGTALNDNEIEHDSFINLRLVTYTDNYPESFSLSLVATDNNKVFTYELENYSYKQEQKTSLEKYLLSKDDKKEFFASDATYVINTYDRVVVNINTEYTNCCYTVGQNTSNEQYLFGFYQKEGNFHIFNKVLLEEGKDPFQTNETTCAEQNSQGELYNIYRSLI